MFIAMNKNKLGLDKPIISNAVFILKVMERMMNNVNIPLSCTRSVLLDILYININLFTVK